MRWTRVQYILSLLLLVHFSAPAGAGWLAVATSDVPAGLTTFSETGASRDDAKARVLKKCSSSSPKSTCTVKFVTDRKCFAIATPKPYKLGSGSSADSNSREASEQSALITCEAYLLHEKRAGSCEVRFSECAVWEAGKSDTLSAWSKDKMSCASAEDPDEGIAACTRLINSRLLDDRELAKVYFIRSMRLINFSDKHFADRKKQRSSTQRILTSRKAHLLLRQSKRRRDRFDLETMCR
jgi:hypothetical protein